MHEALTDFAAAIEQTPELRMVLRNPQLESSEKARILADLAGDEEPLFKNFLLLVAVKGRAGEIDEIAREFEIVFATLFPGGFYSSSFGFFMNEDKWNKLSKQDQDAIASVSGEPLALLTGDALLVGEVGRPDLAVDPREGAQALYASLREIGTSDMQARMLPGLTAALKALD